MPTIKLETVIKAPVEKCFDLSRDVEIHLQSASQTNELAVAGVTSGLLKYGDWVTWEGRHFWIKQHLTVKITRFEQPHLFVDEMLKGSFKELKHTHEFISYGAQGDGTIMQDIFYFRSPFGLLGVLVDKLILEGYMRRFLLKRNLLLKEVAESSNLSS